MKYTRGLLRTYDCTSAGTDVDKGINENVYLFVFNGVKLVFYLGNMWTNLRQCWGFLTLYDEMSP